MKMKGEFEVQFHSFFTWMGWMELNGYIHAPSALSAGKYSTVTI
jgi:hypothetical protein